ncbi:hypothetical protein Glove_114g203 [Diversispora epigaea]|uniref:Uncharacterized protein n=1 Tax=Diversispora epigaea TaxID=1348612 RepID=A0A397J565_9GLOM|nr:hypothetical protein Glove_114g203 [Diversispora epigaea]
MEDEKAEPIEFPNNAYADLMALVTNYNLSNEATNAVIHFFNEHSNLPLSPLPKNAKKGRELMEKMKISTLTSKKHKILTHNNIDYYLFYHPVLNCIKNILSISDISQNFTLRFENFKNTEASLPHGSNLLSIILYSDATTTDTLEAEPIEFPNNAYADLMALVTNYNLSNEATNAVIHFFNEHSNLPLSPLPKNAKKGRELMEKMKISTLTSKKHKILTHNNIDYYLFYHPVLNCIKNILSISDISQNFTLRFENFKNTEASLPHGSNLLSIILYSDATTTDTLEFTQALLQKQDSSLVNKIDNRLSKIPRFQKFQMFTNGLQSISRMTAKEYRILMKVMVFVVDNFYKENENNVENFVENKKLSEVYAKWNKMYMISRSEIFTESDLENFRLKRQDIINVINKKQKKKKPTKLLNFSSKLFETKLTEANIYFCEKMNDPNINDNMIKGFNQFLECFDDFLDNILEVKNIKECDIIIYGMATLENGLIIRAKNKFHDKLWFSNVAISMDSNESSDYQSDEGLCYGKILLMAKIEIEEKPPLNLALVQ